jgi:hypothetical protein
MYEKGGMVRDVCVRLVVCPRRGGMHEEGSMDEKGWHGKGCGCVIWVG